MKLFVWNEPTGCGNTCLFVVAEDIKTARRAAIKAKVFMCGTHEEKPPVSVTTLKNLGKPTRVIDLTDGPYAEVYAWEE
jgi:hypothetical protein